ncbi:MAG: regulatory iron-sulfur-containing complex subunit RicT [Treponemataceae bacterium]
MYDKEISNNSDEFFDNNKKNFDFNYSVENEETCEHHKFATDDSKGKSVLSDKVDKALQKIYSIVMDYCREFCYGICDNEEADFKRGDFVIAKTRYGMDVVKVAGKLENGRKNLKTQNLICIKRAATENEKKRFYANAKRTKEANKIFKEKVLNNALKMQPVTSHFLSAEPKVVFFFTADKRVDFRKLVKDLVAVFKLRVELRQIAVRDESRIVGGLGLCGRAFCCRCMGDKIPSVSIKMAKYQGLSILTQKVSGPCGRLLCCLAFEHEWYAKERSKFPPVGFCFSVNGRSFTVTDINMVMGYVMVSDNQSGSIKASVKNFYFENGNWKVNRDFFSNFL